ncbi:MAG: ribulose bisphosphate carboxylase small subunit [Ilumatobacteraceae bacterium]
MKLTQGTFSFLPDLTDEQISAQVRYCIDNGWAVSIEYTDDPHPRNTYWEMWDMPMFDLASPGPLMDALAACREANPGLYIRIAAFDSTKGWESLRLLFIAQRPDAEPGFFMERAYGPGRSIRYSARPYSTNQPPGMRYR